MALAITVDHEPGKEGDVDRRADDHARPMVVVTFIWCWAWTGRCEVECVDWRVLAPCA